MAQIIKANGEIKETQPSNGTDFSLTELQAVVGGFIEVVHLSDGRLMVVNEEGKLNGLPFNKKASELTDEDKTLYYQRMGFVSHVVGLTRNINGQTVHLCIGGVRAYNEDKLFGRPSPAKYRIFCSWTVKVCTNLMVQAGYIGNLECMTTSDIKEKALELFNGFDPVKEDNLRALESLESTSITEEQFCHVIGRLRLYQALPNTTKTELGLPNVILGDQAVNAAIRGYVDNPNFKKEDGIDLNLFQMLQLFNEAVKQTYLDRWLEKNQNCTDLVMGLERAMNGESQEYAWFLS